MGPRGERRTLALLILGAIGLAVIPEVITHLNVKHTPDLSPLQDDTAASKFPLAHLVSLAGSALLLLLSSAVVARYGNRGRDVKGLLLFLLAVNLPYVVNPVSPEAGDVVKVVLANAFIVALWSPGATISDLRWVPMSITVIAAYSLVGGLVLPEYMMYNQHSEKAIIAGWELAGPFGHGNALGMYCGLAFALVPLIKDVRWRILDASILFATVVLSASRTALVASALVALWWALCRMRSVVSIRFAGTLLAAVTASAMLVLPFLGWNPHAFSDRASVWANALAAWQQSPLFGLGVNWFLTDAQSTANAASWAYVGTGHNVVVDTLVKSGVLGAIVLAPVLVAGILATRAMTVTRQQVACFGYLMAFFVTATMEAVWAILPNLQLFPISGLIFAVLIMGRRNDPAKEGAS